MAAASNQTQAPPAAPSNRRTLTGFVTKLVGNDATYGFINDEIFFQQSSVTVGAPANVNDQVYAECEYSAHLPIKWNATCVKVLNRATGGAGGGPTGVGPGVHQAPPAAAPAPQPQTQMLPPVTGPSVVTSAASSTDSSQVAVTYQQHRQQRLQRQMLELQQQQQQQPLQPPPPTTTTTTATATTTLKQDVGQPNMIHHPQQHQDAPGVDFFAPPMQQNDQHDQPMGQTMHQPHQHQQQQQPHHHHQHHHHHQQQQQQQQQQQPEPNLAPFHDRPMGPPKFAFTNQLGSAFVQSPAQFMPTPFLAQQPPPQIMAQPHQAQLVPSMNNQRQKRDGGGGRYNDSRGAVDKFNMGSSGHGSNNSNSNSGNNPNSNNDNRQQNRRLNSSRNDNAGQGVNKFDRDGNARPRTNLSRDRSSGSSLKKDDTPTRASPPSSRSRTSISSDRGSKSQHKRHYEPTNIPRSRILTDMNSSDMKHRCSSSIHVPSDLKNVIINKHYRLDIRNTPKPVKFSIEQSGASKDEQTGQAPTSQSGSTDKKSSESGSETEHKSKQSDTQSSSTATRSNEATKLNHKYGVKVVLMSLPELEDIYKDVFGQQLDSFTNDQKHQNSLDESIHLLCSKSSSGGNSLIGGKFDPVSDGFVEGATNEFERSDRLPDLIATCKRVVREQTGLDLSSCQSWTHISTFMYNNKSDYFSPKASIEYSYIYMPHIWTMAPDRLENTTVKEESNSEPAISSNEVEGAANESEEQPAMQVEATESEAPNFAQVTAEQQAPGENVDLPAQPELKPAPQVAGPETGVDPNQSVESTTKDSTDQLSVENLAELKVVELKVELDKRGVKYKPNAKKVELVTALREALMNVAASQEGKEVETPEETGAAVEEQVPPPAPPPPPPSQPQDAAPEAAKQPQDAAAGEASALQQEQQLEEGEVLASKEQSPELAEEASEATASDTRMNIDTSDPAGEKRKMSDQEESDLNKRTKLEPTNKTSKVKLITQPFVVRSQGQQALNLVSLYDSSQVSSEYILTTLVENDRQKVAANQQPQLSASDQPQQGSAGSSQNAQETNGDTNNNSNNNNNNNNNEPKGAFKNPSNTSSVTTTSDKQSAPIIVKELPVDRYINLAFVYFDSTHVGYLHYDDLIKLFNNTGLNLSKRALVSLIGENEKFNYRLLPDLSPRLAPTYLYKFPHQFSKLPGACSSSETSAGGGTSAAAVLGPNNRIEYEGVTYTVEKLINQVREAETMRVNYVARFNRAIENHDKQAEEIHVLEVSQKSLSKAIKSQNEEICDLKRERDLIKKKYEHLRRGIETTVSSLNALIKDEK